jgi:UDP-N-acetylglucosamine 2-epimerase (non-hydrolysing)
MAQAFGLSLDEIHVTEPLGYLDFLQLEANARLVLTDSGGLQEESCILGVPCVTLRNNTERPETVEVGANVLAGTDPDVMLSCARKMLAQGTSWANPFGDGKAGDHVIQEVLRCF